MSKIQFKRGQKSNLPILDDAEAAVCLDSKELYVGVGGENILINPEVVDNLETNDPSKILSANQGVVIKTQLAQIATDYYTSELEELTPIEILENYKVYCNTQYKLSAYSEQNNRYSYVYKVEPGTSYLVTGITGHDSVAPLGVFLKEKISDLSSSKPYLSYVNATNDLNLVIVEDYVVTSVDNANYFVVNGSVTTPPKVRTVNRNNKAKFSLNTNNGIIVKNNQRDIIHFTNAYADYFTCRVFKHCFINKLLQLESMFLGKFDEYGVLRKISNIGTSWSDVIGPISIHRKGIDNFNGNWSGGSHGISIDGTELPTAKESDMKIYCNGKLITNDGYYFGNVTIITKNDLYFPKTITGYDLSTATKAIEETRRYHLTTKMEVDVELKFIEELGVVLYYGCQCNTYNMDRVVFPNSMINTTTKNLSDNVVWTDKESKYFCYNDELKSHYDVELKPYGLGTWKYNNTKEYGYLAPFQKTYFSLIMNQTFNAGQFVKWGAEYNYYFD